MDEQYLTLLPAAAIAWLPPRHAISSSMIEVSLHLRERQKDEHESNGKGSTQAPRQMNHIQLGERRRYWDSSFGAT